MERGGLKRGNFDKEMETVTLCTPDYYLTSEEKLHTDEMKVGNSGAAPFYQITLVAGNASMRAVAAVL